MEYRQLRYFIAVAEELHFTRAAERLSMAQPPLSKQIKALEEELGVQLFERSRRHVKLTRAGLLFLEHARRSLAGLEAARRAAVDAHRGEAGRLVVGYVSAAGYELLPRSARTFRERYPSAEVVAKEMATVDMLEDLHDERIDVALLNLRLADDRLQFDVLLREPVFVALPRGHRLARQSEVAMPQLAEESFILPVHLPQMVSGYSQVVTGMFARAGFTPRVAQKASGTVPMLGFVATGAGVALFPKATTAVRFPGVVFRQIRGDPATLNVVAAWRKNDPSAIVKTFLDVLRATAAGIDARSRVR